MGLSPLWGQIGGQLKLQMGKHYMDIIPDALQDEVYIDAMFGVKKTGDVVEAVFTAGSIANLPRLRLMRVVAVN